MADVLVRVSGPTAVFSAGQGGIFKRLVDQGDGTYAEALNGLNPDANGNAKTTLYGPDGQPLEFLSPLSLFSAKGQNTLVADTAEEIIAANASRIGLLIRNTHATIAVYIGDSNAVTVNNGYPLAPAGLTATAPEGSALRLTDYVGPIWAIATGGTPVLAYLEW